MILNWRKLGLVYSLPKGGLHENMRTHTANPLPVHLEGNLYRIFFNARDSRNRSSVGAVDFDLINRKVVCEHKTPFFNAGPKGSFYEDGLSIGCCYEAGNGQRLIPFMGWRNPTDRHWYGEVGCLILNDNATLSLESEMPLLALDDEDPVSISYPWVIQRFSGAYRMYYGSTVTWDAGNGEMLHTIKSASSSDGLTWRKEGLAVPYEVGVAQAFSRPTVLEIASGRLLMWYSCRSGTGEAYRIGCAESADGETWKRVSSGIDVSAEGWDSEMVEYPCVFRHEEKYYLLYNGNGYGKTGIGLAVLEDNNWK